MLIDYTGNKTYRQKEIIAAAGSILTRSGVKGFTIKNLAFELKLSEGAIYRHFSSKEDLIVSMLEFLATNMDERLSQTTSPDQNPEEKFVAIFKSQFAFFNSNPHYVVAVFSDGLMEASESINAVILKIMGVKMKHVMAVIKEGQKDGVFTNAISADELIHIVIGTFRLLMFKWRVSNFYFDLDQTGERMIQSLLLIIKVSNINKK